MTNPYDPPPVVDGGVANATPAGRELFSVLWFIFGFVASYLICGLGYWILTRGMPTLQSWEAWAELSNETLQLFMLGGVLSVPAIGLYAVLRQLPGEKLRYRATNLSVLFVGVISGGVAVVASEFDVLDRLTWISLPVLLGLASLLMLLAIVAESRFAEQVQVGSRGELSIVPIPHSASLIWFSMAPLITGGFVSLWERGLQNAEITNVLFGACFVCFIAIVAYACVSFFVCRGTHSTIGSRVAASIVFSVLFTVPLLVFNHYQLITSGFARVVIVLFVMPAIAGLASASVDRILSKTVF